MFVNLTPHVINVVVSDGETRSIAPSGAIARCAQKSVAVGLRDGIPQFRTSFGAVEGLPPEDSSGETMYVVSALVRSACPERIDVASPGDLVRDLSGSVIGCRGLIVNG